MIDTILNDGIFIIHAVKGYEYHEERIIKYFGDKGIGFQFVTDGDPTKLNQDIIDKYFTDNIRQIVSEGVLSCTLNHIYAYEYIVHKNLNFGIIFENDPFFLGDFRKDIPKYINEACNLPKGFIVSLENTTLQFPSFWQTKKNKYLYPASVGRMAGAYLIDLEAAKLILEDLRFKKCHTVIDWWHNSLVDRGIIKIYWAHPALVEQGSHSGLLSSTISSKKKSILRRISWLLQKAFRYSLRRFFKEKRIL